MTYIIVDGCEMVSLPIQYGGGDIEEVILLTGYALKNFIIIWMQAINFTLLLDRTNIELSYMYE